MIKGLSLRIGKHQRECHEMENKVLGEDIDKFLNNVSGRKKNSGLD